MTYNSSTFKGIFFAFSILCGCALLFTRCNKNNSLQYEVFCNAENIINKSLKGDGGADFSGFSVRKKINDAYSGKYVLALNTDKKNGFGHTFYIKNNSVVLITVWRKKCNDCGEIVIASPEKKFKSTYSGKVVEENEVWQKIEARVKIAVIGNDKIKVRTCYVNDTKDTVIIDDFHIKVFDKKHDKLANDFPSLTKLKLQIKPKYLKKLQEFAAEATEAGVIMSRHKKKFKAILHVNNIPHKVSVRFKGDWADHLETKKWSFRVELDDDVCVLGGLKEFSLQNPKTRHFAEEYYLHDLASSMGLLATRYGFVQLALNDENLGLYAYEEHFTKQLIESQKRREGIIMKFDEEPYWQYRRENSKRDTAILLPSYAAASSLPFGSKKILKSSGLSNQLTQANILMNQFKYSTIDNSEVFDTKKLGLYLALCDYANISHPFIWHNMRLYYNPVISKLEPILFDAFQPFWPKSPKSLIRVLLNKPITTLDQQRYMKYVWYITPEIQKAYLEGLNFILSPEFEKLEKQSRKKSRTYVHMIQKEFFDYSFNIGFFAQSKTEIETSYSDINTLLKTTKITMVNKPFKHHYNESFEHYNVRAYVDKEVHQKITFENFHFDQADSIVLHFKNHHKLVNLSILAFNNTKNLPGKLVIDYPITKKELKKITYWANGKKHKATIYPWAKQISEKTILQQYKASAKIPLTHKIKSDTVWLSKGPHTLSETMTITEGKTLAIVAGTTIDITNNAKIICFGALAISGTKTNPVSIVSSDKTGQGVIVLQAPTKSNLSYVTFDGLNTSLDRFWTLTGSVTFYESNVVMNHVAVKNNPCEDALNIIRSHFDIKNLNITKTASDGFDADYCTGILDSSYFGNTGNDCIDFSTSEITISNITIKNSGDKGISGGEASTLHISNVSIDGAAIGIAAKDKSELYLKNISISNAKYGLAAFQKKPEYGAANISAMQVKLNNVKNPFVLEKNSSIIWDGNINIGTKKLDVKQLYDL
jgi:hypothetical protein